MTMHHKILATIKYHKLQKTINKDTVAKSKQTKLSKLKNLVLETNIMKIIYSITRIN